MFELFSTKSVSELGWNFSLPITIRSHSIYVFFWFKNLINDFEIWGNIDGGGKEDEGRKMRGGGAAPSRCKHAIQKWAWGLFQRADGSCGDFNIAGDYFIIFFFYFHTTFFYIKYFHITLYACNVCFSTYKVTWSIKMQPHVSNILAFD